MKTFVHRALVAIGIPLFLGLNACAYQRVELDKTLEAEVVAADKGLIPTSAFFSDNHFRNMKISPDGRFVGTIYSENGKKVLAVVSPDLSKMLSVHRFQGNVDVIDYEWVNNERLVLRAGETFGNLDGRHAKIRYYFVNFDGTRFKDFFSKEWSYYQLANLTPDDPDTVAMVKYSGTLGKPVAVKVNVNTGTVQTLAIPPREASAILINRKGEANVAVVANPREDFEKQEILVKVKDKWETIVYPAKGETAIDPVYFDSAKNDLYLLSDRETGRKGLYILNMDTKKSTPIFTHEIVDVDDLISEDGRIVGLVFENGRPEIIILDKESETMKLIRDLQTAFPDELVSNLSLTTDKKKGMFRVHSDRSPGDYYSVDVPTRQIRLIGSVIPDLKKAELGPREPVQFKARDGMTIHGYVTLPPEATMKDKLPTIVLVHGGPFGVRDGWAFNPEVQYFASRGYAVLQVNFRGSGGYGHKFQEAGYRQWGKAMQDDVTDGTKWAVDQGIADGNRLCIYGGSYGGYAALQGAVKEPDLYKCAISYVGVSNLPLKFDHGDARENNSGVKWIKKVMGDDEAELIKYSPARNADKIKVPIYIIHGADDVRVPLVHAETMRDGLEEHKKPYEWMVKPSEGHGFTQTANRIEAYHSMVKFFEKHIGKGKTVTH